MKTVETVCYEIMREIVRVHHLFKTENIHVYAAKDVAEYLINEESHALLAELQAFIGKKIEIKLEPYYHQEQFDVVVM
ncbi:Ribonuclease G [Mannheimia haemolytica]|uniref:Ribonuclease G n=1 Tax=Mannheimia haemolytica TaxID=75985 RepID=A0A378N169_MANHA|nr:Ribonuclease G [Mannheimia haemolytica]